MLQEGPGAEVRTQVIIFAKFSNLFDIFIEKLLDLKLMEIGAFSMI